MSGLVLGVFLPAAHGSWRNVRRVEVSPVNTLHLFVNDGKLGLLWRLERFRIHAQGAVTRTAVRMTQGSRSVDAPVAAACLTTQASVARSRSSEYLWWA